MKQNIVILTLGLCIGMLVMINQVCKQKDSMIRLLMNNSNCNSQIKSVSDVPKKFPVVTIK